MDIPSPLNSSLSATAATTTGVTNVLAITANAGTLRRKRTESDPTTITAITTEETKRPKRTGSRSNSNTKTNANTKAESAYSPPSRLRDSIPPNLVLLFIGVNPGIMTGSTGFAYAHPSNLYWKFLHSSGITSKRHHPSDTHRLPELYAVGNTNVVERPTRDASMLTRAEMDAGVPVLEAKIASQRPEAVCLVGKSIWETVWRVKHGGKAIKKEQFRYGWQDETENMGIVDGFQGARVFVATTTSGLAAAMSRAEKEAIWRELGEWVIKRRKERGFVVDSDSR